MKTNKNNPAQATADPLSKGPTHGQIAQRAQQIWEQEGRPDGRDLAHRQQAETELRQVATPTS